MNEKIKAKAQALYPPQEKASEYVAFLRGAKWADKARVEKACQWLEENYYNIYQGTWQEIKKQFINDFKEAMKTNGLIQLRK